MTAMRLPRVLVAGMRGGDGKTLVSLGIAAALRRRGYAVAPFKKGPDYIDAAWLAQAAGAPCRNLDLFLMRPEVIERSFVTAARHARVAVIEGNRGLFDGLDADGTCSTAELSRLLGVPVVLVADCTKSTRTVAAGVLGCQRLDPGVRLSGVILNRTAGARHAAVVRAAVESICGVPVLGVLPRLAESPFPERHLGLVPPQEHGRVTRAIEEAERLVAQHVDVTAVWNIARRAPPIRKGAGVAASAAEPARTRVRVGVFRDAAFQFYYPENLEALACEGAEIVELSPLDDRTLPDVGALYLGGGFPETLAAALSRNTSFLVSLRSAALSGLPVYAECGGAVYLGEQLVTDGGSYRMAGVLPTTFVLGRTPQGHGYVELETVRATPFYPAGITVRGHEFHYTSVQSVASSQLTFAFRVRRGFGIDGHLDGLCLHNVLAAYTHVHALGTPEWASGLVGAAARHRARAPAAAGVDV